MNIKISGSPKEIAALAGELLERRAEYERKSQVNRILEAFRIELSPQSGSSDQSFSLRNEKLSERQENDCGRQSNSPDRIDNGAGFQLDSPAQGKSHEAPVS